MKIGVYTIALNEEQFVQRWAESCKDADYILILDTGSTDKTVELATSLGVNVQVASIKPWRFDTARNAALALLPADLDYCLALDMDEVLLPGWREELEPLLAKGVTRPRYQYTWSWKDTEETVPGLQYGGDKIHTRYGYRWKHPVHETLTTDRTIEVQGWCELQIHHHPDNTKSRGQYFPLLELAVQEDPTDDRNTYYLAREYFFNRMYDKAAEGFKRHLKLPKAVWQPERAASMRYLAKCEPEQTPVWLNNAVREAPGRREPLVELAQWHHNNGDWENTYKHAIQALEIAEKPLDYLCEEFAWGATPHDLAAIAAYNLGDKESALIHGLKALELNPDDERLARNLDWYKSE